MNSIQDILNAFREKFLPKYDGNETTIPLPTEKDILDWLLTTLTEFEREVKEESYKEIINSINRMPPRLGYELVYEKKSGMLGWLDKDLHPSK